MSTRRGTDVFSFQIMVLLCALWGLQQVAIKLAAQDMAPILQASLRSGLAALLVGLLMTWRGGWEGLRQGTLRGGLLAGVLFTLEFLLIALSLGYTSAGHVAVFLYTAPVFSALGLHLLLPHERLRPFQWLGIAVCFTGIGVAFIGGTAGAVDRRMLLGDALAVGAGLAWGLTTVAVRASRLSEAPPALTLFYQLAIAFVLLLGVALVTGKTGHVALTPIVVGSVLFQGVVVSFASYLAWFWLLRRYRASNLAVFSFMTPLFGVTLGVLILHEPLTVNFVLGAVLVLAGIGLVSGEAWLRRVLMRGPSTVRQEN
ncbi:threonine/homoserine efflux transporter RhtA [Archangium gephyra]|uniref:Permease of the drug/metabolite transporter n=1 Tax=Archangium gephyra TaxID=48 RepID=A0AAC8Q9T2_9BACT|nr:DMT family transporter [Archangium gephyra]AKJ03697.1 Permease of the drug/metabolite transporter [Archangium gephyra]REG22522.1 threonine/homoserine efflux transporter RhtA [Archangium gephyra]